MKNDQGLQADVQQELRSDPSIDESQIGLVVKDGIVTLTGRVPSVADHLGAERAARRVYGVRAVANEMEVKLAPASQRSDTELARAALDAIKWHSAVPDERITLVVDKGWITMEGSVEWQYQREAAEGAVRNLTGVRGVTNLIVVAPSVASVTPADVKEKIRLAFERNADLDARRVGVKSHEGKVILHGNVRSWHERDEAARAAWNIPGVRELQNDLTVTP